MTGRVQAISGKYATFREEEIRVSSSKWDYSSGHKIREIYKGDWIGVACFHRVAFAKFFVTDISDSHRFAKLKESF